MTKPSSIFTAALTASVVLFACNIRLTGQSGEGVDRLLDSRDRAGRVESEALAKAGVRPAVLPADTVTRLQSFELHRRMREETPHKNLPWHFLGPDNVSGRITDLAVPTPRGESYTIYAATATGGVWRTSNEGTTWEPIFDREASISIGDLALDPKDPNVLWVGTGEANIFRSSTAGCGIYKTEDGGKTWQHRGLEATHTIARIVVDPRDSNTLYVAAGGHEWTDNVERGVYKTTDGGESWRKVLFVNDRTGAVDLVINPKNPDVLYAATWQRIRQRWNDPRVIDGYEENGLWKSLDGGETWGRVNDGLPEAKHRGRIGIDLCQAHPSTVYAFVDCYELADGEAPEGEDSYGRSREKSIEGAQVYRSDDDGKSWRKTSKSDKYMRGACSTYGWVFGQIRVDPVDPDTVYIMGLALNVSTDSGQTFRRLRGMHGDHHALWIDPVNPDYLINGNDGGAAISYDGGQHWRTTRESLPAVQFYNVGYDLESPFHVYGSIQDHGSRRGTVTVDRDKDRIFGSDWRNSPGGEASTHAVDPSDSNTLYSEGFYGSINRTDLSANKRTAIRPEDREGEPKLRGQWLAPFIISPHNPRIIYHGMNHLFRSMDRGDRWQRISPDLSYNDPDKLGDIQYQTIFAIAESPQSFGSLYVGTDDGRAHYTSDGGSSWVEITNGLAPNRWISRIEASRFTSGTIYLAQNGKRNDDFTAYLWRSKDHGVTWSDIAAGIPCGPINVVREDPDDADLLYVGTDLGVYVSTDAAKSWRVLGSGLPTAHVHDLIIHPEADVAVIATHGRGMYALDVQPLRKQDPADDVRDDAVEAGKD